MSLVINLLNINAIRKGLKTEIIGKPHIVYYSEITSTNDCAKKHGKLQAVKEGTLIIAEHQTAGRGRYGRTWEAPKGKCILASVIFRHRLKHDKVHLPNLIGALSIAQAINELTGLAARIKHPNDVRISRKKVAGVLTEMQYDSNHVPFFVLGFGVNVNTTQSELPKKLRQKATSVSIAASSDDKIEVSRRILLQTILEKLEANYLHLKTGETERIAKAVKVWEEKE
ncbi:biotin--[acetyl-CoA-carboxylase] ligase [Candidatus Poribacteria bacterium]|nr:biotin--[acetyl-CoA-carboxylase] ligase [Candidatus Poribacteria bacterium]MYB65955.1 biotin--[acetyl-CoA-carboxylase] ligase [Candidatus Poribacteria bacterium]MYF54957.1 biotin--[acetyl-CoA-carboxylase] ligase [Candidatus Poribacteria bacterium]